ncbi:MAG: hypothetical protein LAT62_06510 [Natronospirillum sp.]|uniref:hypothetical protein n=1 Tax=Natronospirillum sp. TaxID=2812955 RepID=UPI0025D25B3D|nr:hypothetical protein [Natronospirillum sp.]MCH8551567.1 hypothetical protein [Natronospirillum sp.]
MLNPKHPLQLALGLTVWSVWFVALYGGLSVVCAFAPPAPEAGPWTALNAGLLALTLVTTALLAWWGWRCWQASAHTEQGSNARLITRVSAGCHLLAALATLMIGLPAAVLPACI